MTNPCRKNCENCAVRGEIHCGGCRSVIENAGCEIAECAEKNNHETCATCTMRPSCPSYRKAASMHIRRQEALEEAQRKQEQIHERAVILGKWMRVMFWLLIARTALTLIGSLTEETSAANLVLSVAADVPELLYAFCLWKIRGTDSRYSSSAVMYACGTLLSIAGALPDSAILQLLLLLPSAVLLLVATYRIYIAHSWVTADLDRELSDNWERLWKFEIIKLIGSMLTPILTVLGLLGVLALLALLVFSLVVDVLAFVYLYRSAELFRSAAED